MVHQLCRDLLADIHGWLTATKISPLMVSGETPKISTFEQGHHDSEETICWQIGWHDESIGQAQIHSRYRHDGSGTVTSRIAFDRLPLGEMMTETLGPLSSILTRSWSNMERIGTALQVTTSMEFSADGQFQGFRTRVTYPEVGELLRIHGVALSGVLQVKARLSGQGTTGPGQELFTRRFQVPEGALIADSLTPYPRLRNLRLGQRWTFPTFRPFPPNNPLQLIEATVDHAESLMWDGEYTTTFVVDFRNADDSGIRSDDKRNARLWVTRDGTVLKQQLFMGDLQMNFVRLPEDACSLGVGE